MASRIYRHGGAEAQLTDVELKNSGVHPLIVALANILTREMPDDFAIKVWNCEQLHVIGVLGDTRIVTRLPLGDIYISNEEIMKDGKTRKIGNDGLQVAPHDPKFVEKLVERLIGANPV
jgi:hypothetical protein